MSYQPPPGEPENTAARQQPLGGYQEGESRALRRWYGAQWDQQARPLPGEGQESQPLYPRQPDHQQPRQSSFTPSPQYGTPPGQLTYQDRPRYPGTPNGQPQPPPGYHGRPGRASWPRHHKVLTVLGGLAALIIIGGIAIATGGGNAKQTGDASPVAATTPTHTATPSRAPTHHATKKKTRPQETPVTAQAATPAPAATAPAAVPSPPASTARAVAPSPSAAATSAGCHPLSNEGTCYEPGEYCRNADHGTSGIARDGEAITCEDNDGWRWEPS